MYDCPYESKKLDEISLAIKDGTHGSFKRKGNGIPFLSAKNISKDGIVYWDDSDDFISETDYLAITSSFGPQKDDLLLTIVGTLGRRALFKSEKLAFQRSVAFIRPDISKISPRFLFHATGTPHFSHQLNRRSNATAQAGLYLGELAKTSIPVPGKDEQFRIAYVLDTIDETIAKSEAVIAKLKQVRAGLLHDLLRFGLDENGQIRDPVAHPEQFKGSPLGKIPKKWKIKKCEDICREIVVGIVVTPAKYYENEGVPVLRSANIREDGVYMHDLVFISEASNQLHKKSILRAGDVLTVRTGYPGTTCVVPSYLDGSNCVDLIISRPSPEVTSEFLALWINSPFGKEQVLRVQGGLAQKHFNIGDMKKLLVPMPMENEQNRITRKLFKINNLLEIEIYELKKLNLLKSGLQDDLLTGRVRVPENLSSGADEP